MRLDNLPENEFMKSLKDMRFDIEQIKREQLSGRDIFVPKLIECLDVNGNPTQYDLVADTPDGFGGMESVNFVAQFVAETQQETWGIPLFKMYIGNPTTLAQPNEVGGFCYLDFPTTYPQSIGYAGYFVNNQFPDLRNVYLKVFMYCTDEGVLTVTETP